MTRSSSEYTISSIVSSPSMKLSSKLVTGKNVISARVLFVYLNNGTVLFKL